MLSGLRDALNGSEPQVDVQAMMPKAAEIFKARQEEANAEQNADQIAFLETAAAEAGAVQTESGLVIKETLAGSGASPSASDSVEVHYEGKLIDGTVFDSSRKRGKPATFSPSGVIKGWTEALQLMRPGDRWKLYIPASLGCT